MGLLFSIWVSKYVSTSVHEWRMGSQIMKSRTLGNYAFSQPSGCHGLLFFSLWRSFLHSSCSHPSSGDLYLHFSRISLLPAPLTCPSSLLHPLPWLKVSIGNTVSLCHLLKSKLLIDSDNNTNHVLNIYWVVLHTNLFNLLSVFSF